MSATPPPQQPVPETPPDPPSLKEIDYWSEPPGEDLPSAYWIDPHPEIQGMLSADVISAYNALWPGGMINPFEPKNLKPAAYELTLGPYCLVDGAARTLDESDPWLEIPPNSIVFVSMRERLRLPHYIAARFDLAIEFIYQGILLGTGPQVDPGFQGVLSCPLHNISNESVHIRMGYPFAKIDFAKTSGLRFAPQDAGGNSERSLYAQADEGLAGFDGHPVKLFNRNNRWRQPIYSGSYAGQRRVRSSVREMGEEIAAFRHRIDDFRGDIDRLRRFGVAAALAAVVAVIAVLITLAQLDRSYTDSRIDKVQGSSPVVQQLRDRVTSLEAQVKKLQAATVRSGRNPQHK